MEIDYQASYHSFSNQYSIHGHNSFFRDKHKEKLSRIKTHHEEIFRIYENWVSQSLIVDINLVNFDLGKLNIGVHKQIIPIDTSSNGKLRSLWSKAKLHLNCDDHIDAYENLADIVELEKKFNNSMKEFLQR